MAGIIFLALTLASPVLSFLAGALLVTRQHGLAGWAVIVVTLPVLLSAFCPERLRPSWLRAIGMMTARLTLIVALLVLGYSLAFAEWLPAVLIAVGGLAIFAAPMLMALMAR